MLTFINKVKNERHIFVTSKTIKHLSNHPMNYFFVTHFSDKKLLQFFSGYFSFEDSMVNAVVR